MSATAAFLAVELSGATPTPPSHSAILSRVIASAERLELELANQKATSELKISAAVSEVEINPGKSSSSTNTGLISMSTMSASRAIVCYAAFQFTQASAAFFDAPAAARHAAAGPMRPVSARRPREVIGLAERADDATGAGAEHIAQADLELAAQIGQELLQRNKETEEKVSRLEHENQHANDTIIQLKHELQVCGLTTTARGGGNINFS